MIRSVDLVTNPVIAGETAAEELPIDRLDLLAAAIRAYHSAAERTDAADQQRQLRWICAALARLLGQRLQGQDCWSKWRWVDDVLPYSALAPTPAECEVRGLAIWAEGGTGDWREPFAGYVRFDAGGTLAEYTLRFGDAAAGLGGLSEKRLLELEAGVYVAQTWLFTCSLPDEDHQITR